MLKTTFFDCIVVLTLCITPPMPLTSLDIVFPLETERRNLNSLVTGADILYFLFIIDV